MAVKVLITRRFKEGKAMDVLSLLNHLRSEAMNQPGYITGETLAGHDDPQKLLVIATWDTLEHWLRWKDNPTRKEHESKLADFLETPVQYESFILGAFPRRK